MEVASQLNLLKEQQVLLELRKVVEMKVTTAAIAMEV